MYSDIYIYIHIYIYIYAVCYQGRGGIRRGSGSDRVFSKRDHHLKKISFPKLGDLLTLGKSGGYRALS